MSDHPPAADLDASACPAEPAGPTDEALKADPLAPQTWEAKLLGWGRCNQDARARLCRWHRERGAAELACPAPLPAPEPFSNKE